MVDGVEDLLVFVGLEDGNILLKHLNRFIECLYLHLVSLAFHRDLFHLYFKVVVIGSIKKLPNYCIFPINLD